MIKINIEEGEILINSAWVSFLTSPLIIVEVDIKSKNPQISGYSEKELWLVAGQHTLYKGSDPRPTKVGLELPKHFRISSLTIGRYSVEIYCVNEKMKNSQETKMIWENK